MDESTDKDKEKNKELSKFYKIFKKIYLKAPQILKDLSNESIDIDFKEWIEDCIDLKKINNTFKENKYDTITDVIKDIRFVLLNCYKFYGAKSVHTMESLQFEELLEKEISHLDENSKSQADIQLTINLLGIKKQHNFKFKYPKDCYDSVLLRCVAHCRPERLKEYHRILSTSLTTDEDNAHVLEELMCWEKEIYFNDHYRYISSMWELPEIGNFMAIIFKEFEFDIINQGEIERMFLMPKESTTMSKIMTTLLMPIKKAKCVGRVMPYKVWSGKLCKKVSEWYKLYHSKKRNKVKVMQSLGIHPDFWAVVGEKNPLLEFDYYELSYFMKVWLVKGLCDFVINKYKTINDVILNCNERQCTIWKNELQTEEYFFFNTMPDFRIYYYNIPYDDEPCLQFLEPENDEETTEENVLTAPNIPRPFFSKSRVKPNRNNFKLIADSVQGLRSFLNELNIEDSVVPDSLINALEDLIAKSEPLEYNLIDINNNSKIKLFKDWKSYSERLEIERDETVFWEEKEIKQTTLATTEKLIWEKRNRKTVVREGFDTFNNLNESDEYCSQSEDCTMSDFTDSEDEWGAMNQSKNKIKQSVKTSSKLEELENRLREEGKLPKNCANNAFNFKKKDEEKNDLIDDNPKENHLYSNPIQTPELEMIKLREKGKLLKHILDKEVISEKRKRKAVVHNGLDTDNLYDSDEYFSEHSVLSDLSDSEDEWGAINQPKNTKQLVKVSSKLMELENRLIEEGKLPNASNLKNNDDLCKNEEKELVDDVQNEKYVNNTKPLINGCNKQLISADNMDSIKNDIDETSDEEVVLIENVKKENKNPLVCRKLKFNDENKKSLDDQPIVKRMKSDGTECTDIVTLDDDGDGLDNCDNLSEINDSSAIISNALIGKIVKANEQDSIQSNPEKSNLKNNIEVISIDDDDDDGGDQIVISDDDDDDVQIVSITPKAKKLPVKIARTFSLNNGLNRSNNLVSRNRRQMVTTNSARLQVTPTCIPKLSPNVSIMPANVHLPKGIEVTMVKKPQNTISSHFNTTKRLVNRSNGHVTNKSSVVNVECRVISKPNLNGEVKFYVNLPNGNLHPVSDELMNHYLKEHNNRLPDYWMVPLPADVAKQYGFN